jgi:hypothetical protein
MQLKRRGMEDVLVSINNYTSYCFICEFNFDITYSEYFKWVRYNLNFLMVMIRVTLAKKTMFHIKFVSIL